MSQRGSGSVCLLCRIAGRPGASPQIPISARKKLSTARQLESTDSNDGSKRKLPPWQTAFTPAELKQQLELPSTADVLRRVMLGPRQTYRSRSINQQISAQLLQDAPRNPGFRRVKNWDQAGGVSKEAAIELLRFQIRACSSQEDIVRIVTVALSNPHDKRTHKRAKLVANRSLQNEIKKKIAGGDAKRNMALVGLLISRLEAHSLEVSLGLLYEALKAAAVTHSLTAFKRYFKMWQDRNQAIGNTLGIGPASKLLLLLGQGFSEESSFPLASRRQGVLEFLIGSGDSMSQKYNLSNHLSANNFSLLGPWLALLANCRAGDQIWNEWKLTQTGTRWHQKHDDQKSTAKFEKNRAGLFILALFRAGQPERAWKVFVEIDKLLAPVPSPDDPVFDPNVAGIHESVWDSLLAHIKIKPDLGQHSQQALDQTMLKRLEELLTDIEKRLRVVWNPSCEERGGFHTGRNGELDDLNELERQGAVAEFERLANRKLGFAETLPQQDALETAVQNAERAIDADQHVLDTLMSSIEKKVGGSRDPTDPRVSKSDESSSATKDPGLVPKH